MCYNFEFYSLWAIKSCWWHILRLWNGPQITKGRLCTEDDNFFALFFDYCYCQKKKRLCSIVCTASLYHFFASSKILYANCFPCTAATLYLLWPFLCSVFLQTQSCVSSNYLMHLSFNNHLDNTATLKIKIKDVLSSHTQTHWYSFFKKNPYFSFVQDNSNYWALLPGALIKLGCICLQGWLRNLIAGETLVA